MRSQYVIHKFTLPLVGDESVISMPQYARVLSVQDQGGELRVWALVDVCNPLVSHLFQIVGTGREVEGFGHTLLGDYLSTVQMGAYVWHIFYKGEVEA